MFLQDLTRSLIYNTVQYITVQSGLTTSLCVFSVFVSPLLTLTTPKTELIRLLFIVFVSLQLIILMALAKGTSRIRTGSLTLHTETAIHIAEMMTRGKVFNDYRACG